MDDDSRITQAFLNHEADLGRFLAQMVRDRELANDLLQDTWLTVVSSRGDLPPEGELVPWLFGIARNRALMALRGRRRAAEALRRLSTAIRPAVVDTRADDPDALRDFLASVLGPEDRSLFLLRYVFGFSSAELARMTGRSPAAVRKRLSRAAQAVTEALDRADPHLREAWSINA